MRYQLLRTLCLAEVQTNILTEKTANEANALLRYWKSIDWDKFLATLISQASSLLIACLILLFFRKIGLKLIKKSFANYRKKQSFSENRIETLEKLSTNIYQYTLFFILIYTVLTILGVPIGSLIAGAGIAGIAIGLGAQGFINDLITGFFIILERQVEVGDFVRIEAIEGEVLAVGLRTTQIKSADGTVHYIPNRSILIISNHSRGDMRALITLRLKPNSNLTVIEQTIQTVNDRLIPDYPEITKAPTVIGVVDLGDGILAYRVALFTKNGAQNAIQSIFLEAYISALHEVGIEIMPSPLQLGSI